MTSCDLDRNLDAEPLQGLAQLSPSVASMESAHCVEHPYLDRCFWRCDHASLKDLSKGYCLAESLLAIGGVQVRLLGNARLARVPTAVATSSVRSSPYVGDV